jgi:uncharacterized membrane protein YjgN (DUF898 family)
MMVIIIITILIMMMIMMILIVMMDMEMFVAMVMMVIKSFHYKNSSFNMLFFSYIDSYNKYYISTDMF